MNDPHSRPTGGTTPSGTTPGGTTTRMGTQQTGGDSGTARGAAEQVKEGAREAKDTAREAGARAAEAVKERGRSEFEDRKVQAAEQVEGVAHALRKTAGELDNESERGVIARYANDAADRLENASHALRERSLDELADQAEDWARRQPAAFVGGAVAAGFLFARFLKASSERRTERRTGVELGSGSPVPSASARSDSPRGLSAPAQGS